VSTLAKRALRLEIAVDERHDTWEFVMLNSNRSLKSPGLTIEEIQTIVTG